MPHRADDRAGFGIRGSVYLRHESYHRSSFAEGVMTAHGTLPNWVTKRGGRLVPFDGDKVCRAVFAAGERVGRPDPFLARELTDGVLHFLAEDGADDPLPTDRLAEVVITIVRELGHPALAQSFLQYRTAKARLPAVAQDRSDDGLSADDSLGRLIAGDPLRGSPAAARELTRRAAGAAFAAFSRHCVYPRDLVAAEREGLLHFLDLDAPLELAGATVEPKPPAGRSAGPGWVEALEAARERVGGFVAIDSPEHVLAPFGPVSGAGAWVRELRIGLRATGLRAVVNLNIAATPAWAFACGGGPLFPPPSDHETDRIADLSDALLDHLLDGDTSSVRIDWHLGERDFLPPQRNRLLRLVRRVLDGAPMSFVPDRPRRPVVLSEGLDRQHPAVLGVVGISLPRLLAIASPEGSPTVEPSPFLAKLGSLARLALSAGHARREHLRRSARAAVTQGFLLDRARLMIVPFGLDSVVRTVTGQSASAGGSSLEFTCHILQTLYATLQNDPPRHFPACLDAMPPCAAIDERGAFVPDDRDGTPRQQLRAAGVLHTVVEAGTAVVRLPGERSPSPEEVAHLLWYAWQQPGLVRVRFVRQFPARRQLSAGW